MGTVVTRIVNIHQPNYIPALSYFAKMAAADVFVILDDVEYSKNNWTNRNRLKGANGLVWLTVPVRYSNGSRQLISEIEPVNESKWRTKHWRTLTANYSRAPCFSAYEGSLRAIYDSEWAKLAALNEQFLRQIAGWLDITGHTRIVKSSDLKVPGTSTERLVEICKALDADTYLCGAGGLHYMDVGQFEKAGIEVIVHEYADLPYRQCWGPFAERLSVLDAVLNIGGSQAREILQAGSRTLSPRPSLAKS